MFIVDAVSLGACPRILTCITVHSYIGCCWLKFMLRDRKWKYLELGYFYYPSFFIFTPLFFRSINAF